MSSRSLSKVSVQSLRCNASRALIASSPCESEIPVASGTPFERQGDDCPAVVRIGFFQAGGVDETARRVDLEDLASRGVRSPPDPLLAEPQVTYDSI
jgi:hypothetical protein